MALLDPPRVSVFASHGVILLLIAQRPDRTIRELAAASGLSERRVGRLLKDLIETDMIVLSKQGKRNRYRINEDAPCSHPSLPRVSLGDVLSLVRGKPEPAPVGRERMLSRSFLPGLLLPFSQSEAIFSLLPLL